VKRHDNNISLLCYTIASLYEVIVKLVHSCTARKQSYLIRLHGDDGAEGVAEGMDVLHVEVVGGDGVRDGVVGQVLRLFCCHSAHLFWVQFDWIVPVSQNFDVNKF